MTSLLWKNFQGHFNDKENIDLSSEMDEKVFDDLKLRRLLETIYDTYSDAEEVLEIMMKIPNLESIIYRREIFDDILNSQEDINKIYYMLVDLVSRKEACTNATEKIKRRFLLVFYYYNLSKFLKETYRFIKNNNYKAEGFIRISKKIQEFFETKKELVSKTNDLYNKIMSVMHLSAEYHDGAPYITLENEKKNNLEDELIDIAKKLDIKLDTTVKLNARKEINAYYLLELTNMNPDIKDQLFSYYDENYENIIDISKYTRELKYYVMIKLLFDQVHSLNIPYTKCEFNKESIIEIKDAYDISLATQGIKTIPNKFNISNNENIQFILGVNSGGKTCYIRSVGINCILGMTTGFMFASKANIQALKYINTHFPNEENYKVGDGRLIDEINRLGKIEKTFSESSITFLNETFSSTSEDRACELTYELIKKSQETKAKILFVTHQYKIFNDLHSENIGFYTPEVSEKASGNERTYHIKKVEKELLSYAQDILQKHGLTREKLLEKKASRGTKI